MVFDNFFIIRSWSSKYDYVNDTECIEKSCLHVQKSQRNRFLKSGKLVCFITFKRIKMNRHQGKEENFRGGNGISKIRMLKYWCGYTYSFQGEKCNLCLHFYASISGPLNFGGYTYYLECTFWVKKFLRKGEWWGNRRLKTTEITNSIASSGNESFLTSRTRINVRGN